jgi:hypothetical protein
MRVDKVTNLVEWKVEKNFTYPLITVCHPKFFSLERMKGT